MSHSTSIKNLEAGRRPPREEAASLVPWVGARRSVEALRRGRFIQRFHGNANDIVDAFALLS